MSYIIYMNLRKNTNENNDFNASNEDVPNANSVMQTAMSALWDIAIAPNQSKFTDEEQSTIALIGITFKMIAEKASIYEQEHENFNNNPSNDWSNN